MERPWHGSWPEGVPKTIEYPKIDVAGILARAAKEWPDGIATQFYGATLTYRELDAAASRFAGGLRTIGVKPGDRVSILMPNCPQFLIALFGIIEILGGIMALRRKMWGLALVGSILGLFFFGWLGFEASLLSFIALILLVISKKEF